ncbi:MAG TPA: hypothetical protein P5205_10150 [Candidatus Paceibacterota bacterium]|nr:hypothetical protein [Verrucomicrobiota bacterium]HSA10716.1 hypothetical protein [Candidatus Paceibacterota bacterium]
MRESLPGRLLIALLQAPAEKMAAIEEILYAGKAGIRSAEDASVAPRFAFRRAGSHWRVVFAGNAEFYIEDTLGARYLDYLLHHPNEPVSAFDLEVAIRPEKAGARAKDSIQEQTDPEAARRYLRELSRLRAEREEDADNGRQTEAEHKAKEIAALEEALRGGGLAGDAGERARSNVNKALALVRRRLARGDKAEREFGAHVGQFVSVGYQCVYAAPGGGCWE